MTAGSLAIQDDVAKAKLSLTHHAFAIATRIERRETGTLSYHATKQGKDARRLCVIAEAFGIDADPLFVDGFTAWSIYYAIRAKVDV